MVNGLKLAVFFLLGVVTAPVWVPVLMAGLLVGAWAMDRDARDRQEWGDDHGG